MISTIRRLRERATTHERETGASMAEMLVVIMVLGIVMAIVQGTVILAQRTTGDTADRLTSASQAQLAMDAMSKNLRTAVKPYLISACSTCATVAFMQGTPTSVQFYANNHDDLTRIGPSKVTYRLEDGKLYETQQKPDVHLPSEYDYTYCDPGDAGCVISERVLATGITDDTLFQYFDRTGAELSGSVLNASQLALVDSVDVSVIAQDGRQTSTLVQRVSLPNADTLVEATETPTPTPTPTSTRRW